jgi:hypothetical protein
VARRKRLSSGKRAEMWIMFKSFFERLIGRQTGTSTNLDDSLSSTTSWL